MQRCNVVCTIVCGGHVTGQEFLVHMAKACRWQLRRGDRGRDRERRRDPLLKSNNPHLTGGGNMFFSLQGDSANSPAMTQSPENTMNLARLRVYNGYNVSTIHDKAPQPFDTVGVFGDFGECPQPPG